MSVFASYLQGHLRSRLSAPVMQAPPNPMQAYNEHSDDDRDVAIRTMLGEAMGEGEKGMAAVAHVLLNRKRTGKWGNTVKDVALAPKQFSAWNTGEGGNDLVRKYGPGSEQYQQAARIYDMVAAGVIPDPTGGATHYYAHGAMGEPYWWDDVTPGPVIGGHSFAR